ncbi:MAG: hypothetical protein HY689_03530 [Chloroflexi bacterium]|nr:hypothetical protein [Chloroflexota bacterium]
MSPVSLSLLGILALFLSACAGSSSTPQPTPTSAPPTPTPSPTAEAPAVVFSTPPRPLQLPQDDAPHRDPLEWWYYTGHLEADGGRRYGFEFVIFQRLGQQSQNGAAGYVGHFAITDLVRNRFVLAEKLNLAPLPEEGGRGFALTLDGWSMTGFDGQDRITADLEGYRLDLSLKAAKPPVAHGTTGYIIVAEKENSYYYSRTRMQATGTLTVEGEAVPVRGLAWFDHQWGQMTLAGSGGWDWFALTLEDGTEVMISIIRAADGRRVAAYGTLVDAQGTAQHLPAEDLRVQNNGIWISPKTGAKYPMGWTVVLPKQGLDLTITPDLMQQELDTSASTGVIYWEGKATVRGFQQGIPMGGMAYVELTGYAPQPARQGSRSAP